MTIEKIICGLEAIKVFLDRSEFVGLEEQTKNQCEILDHAMDTMHKYQKIEQIMSADLEHIHPLDRDKYIVASIKEVLEDDKI